MGTRPAQAHREKDRHRRNQKRHHSSPSLETNHSFEHLISSLSPSIQPIENGERRSSASVPLRTSRASYAKLLIVEPSIAFAHWSINPQTGEKALARLGRRARLILRVYDITEAKTPLEAPFSDCEAFEWHDTIHLRLAHPNQRLFFDVLVGNGKEEEYLCRSQVLRLPNGFASNGHAGLWRVEAPDADHPAEDWNNLPEEELREIMGPYFFDLYRQGNLANLSTSHLAAYFHAL